MHELQPSSNMYSLYSERSVIKPTIAGKTLDSHSICYLLQLSRNTAIRMSAREAHSTCAKLAPSRPVRQTPAATMGAGADSCAAMGSASATVMLRGTSARARPARRGAHSLSDWVLSATRQAWCPQHVERAWGKHGTAHQQQDV